MSNVIKINDFDAKELDVYARLSEGQLLNRHEPEKGIFIAESPIVVERALDAGCEPISILVEDRHIKNQAKNIIERCGNIPIFTAPFDVLTGITGFKLTRGMLCAMHRPKLKTVEEICKDKRRVAVLYRRAIRVSMGTVFQIPWTFIDEKEGTGIELLHNMGFKTAAMALTDNSVSIDDKNVKSEEKLAIILGTEGEGLHQNTINSSDYTIKIPMSHGVDSLNVAAASAVAFWELGK